MANAVVEKWSTELDKWVRDEMSLGSAHDMYDDLADEIERLQAIIDAQASDETAYLARIGKAVRPYWEFRPISTLGDGWEGIFVWLMFQDGVEKGGFTLDGGERVYRDIEDGDHLRYTLYPRVPIAWVPILNLDDTWAVQS